MSSAFGWFITTLMGLFVIQLLIHRALYRVSYALLGNGRAALKLYALLLLPGVMLHELAHAVTALLLGVRVTHISLTPTWYLDGTVSLGEVWLRQVGYVRSSLIGLAPLVFGSAAIVAIGQNVFGGTSLETAVNLRDAGLMITALREMISLPDVSLWLYLLLTIAITMLPSEADRYDWPYLILFITAILFIATLLRVDTTAIQSVIDGPLAWLAGSFSIALLIGVPFLALILMLSMVLRGSRHY